MQPWNFGKFQLGLTTADKTEITLKVDNVWDSNGSNWIATSEGFYAGQFDDPRYHNLQARFRPRNIGLTIRKNF